MKAMLAITLALAPVASLAQAGLGGAAVFSCRAGPSCDDAGACADVPFGLFVIETFRASEGHGATYIAGPLAEGAGAGLFHERPIRPMGSDGAVSDILALNPEILGPHLYLVDRQADDPVRYAVIRPGSEVPGLSGNRVLTRFDCRQELYE